MGGGSCLQALSQAGKSCDPSCISQDVTWQKSNSWGRSPSRPRPCLGAQNRATLGYHASGRQGTELIYGRDNIAAPLRDLERVILEVAMKRFFPDSTRSGYISKKPDEQYEELSDSSSQGSENEDQPDHSEDEQAADAMVGQFGPVPLEERGLFRHKISRVIHVCDSEEGLAFKCQRKVSSSYAALSSAPLVMHPLCCKQCFPEGVDG